ncbi:MAG TPA: cysteine desulfurase family protein [Acidimicrobiales bacterium]|jgi:cysteine desulfurase|nr:cysteine desulfurase family protein [Acidimicrobiales bacterium]
MRHYLDHASTSPARPEVVEAMVPWLANAADPGRVHTEGRLARGAVESARESVAALLGARSREVVFTSGATEAINAAVWGAVERGSHIVCPVVEHSAVRDAAARYDVSWVGVDHLGRVDADEVIAAIGPDTALVNLQWANHEVATLQPVAAVVAECRERGVLVHVDAAQAVGHVPVDFGALGADLLSVSAHKFGGPQGVGALLVRRGLRLRPLLVGGEQERARRAGMENVAAIAGFGAAADVVSQAGRLEAEADVARAQTARVVENVPNGVVTYGDTDVRLPHLVCLGVEGVEAEAVLLGLDQAGIAAHSGSACSSESLEPSPVLEAMGVDAERSLRVSVGWSTTDDDIDAILGALPDVVSRLRALGATDR